MITSWCEEDDQHKSRIRKKKQRRKKKLMTLLNSVEVDNKINNSYTNSTKNYQEFKYEMRGSACGNTK